MSVTIILHSHEGVTSVDGLVGLTAIPLENICEAIQISCNFKAEKRGCKVLIHTRNPSMIYTWLTTTKVLDKEVPVHFLISYERLI
jgi:hypothetical protein